MTAWTRIAKLLPLLGSDKDGEVLAAVAALQRTLDASDLDWHDLAGRIDAGAPEPPKPAPEPAGRAVRPGEDLLLFLAATIDLKASERKFADSCAAHLRRKPLSPKQIDVLREIAQRYGWHAA